MMEMEGDRARTTMAMAIARIWKDPEYKRQFMSDPKNALSREGVNFGEHTTIKVVEETATTKYVDLEGLEQTAQETLSRLLPLADGHEIRLVQSTDSLRYLVLPAAPGWISPGISGSDDFLKLSAEQPATVISETTLVEAQLVTAESAAIEQTIQESVSAEELIVESAVVVQSANQTVQEVQVIEVTAEFEVETSIGAVAVEYIA